MPSDPEQQGPDERRRRIRSKNLVLLAVLVALVVLFYVVTIVRMGSGQ